MPNILISNAEQFSTFPMSLNRFFLLYKMSLINLADGRDDGRKVFQFHTKDNVCMANRTNFQVFCDIQ